MGENLLRHCHLACLISIMVNHYFKEAGPGGRRLSLGTAARDLQWSSGFAMDLRIYIEGGRMAKAQLAGQLKGVSNPSCINMDTLTALHSALAI